MTAAPSPSDAQLRSALALSAALGKRELTSVQIVSACLARIRAEDLYFHAFSEVYEAEAMAAADAADRMMRAGYQLGPLHGIPVAVKDLVDIAGKVTTSGSPLFASRLAQRSAVIVERLWAAGAIIVGKTQMVQFALGAWGTNEHMGTPRNPWDHGIHRTPGGSSSGSAVAVAAGLVPLAIGTDTGGSVRVPASFCGITGLKVTAGRIDTAGVMPLSTTLDSIGIFAQSIADASLLYAVLVDEKRMIGHSSAARQASVAGLRLGRLSAIDLDGVATEIKSAYEAAIDVFHRGGAQLTVIKMPRQLDAFAQAASAIMLSEGAAEYGELAADASALMDSSVRPRFVAGSRISAVEYVRAMRQRAEWKLEFADLLVRTDAFLTPTTMSTAVPVDTVDHGFAPVRFTRVLNLLDMCGISVPAGLDCNQLPIGLQIGALEGQDEQLIDVATAFQGITDFHLQVPARRHI